MNFDFRPSKYYRLLSWCGLMREIESQTPRKDLFFQTNDVLDILTTISINIVSHARFTLTVTNLSFSVRFDLVCLETTCRFVLTSQRHTKCARSKKINEKCVRRHEKRNHTVKCRLSSEQDKNDNVAAKRRMCRKQWQSHRINKKNRFTRQATWGVPQSMSHSMHVPFDVLERKSVCELRWMKMKRKRMFVLTIFAFEMQND